jgi:glycine cleavage system H protein
MEFPEKLLYTAEHEWVRVKGDVAVVGITEHAQSELGDIVFVELPEVETDLEQGHEFGVVESVKTVSNLYTPVTGTVKKVNKKLVDNPELVNSEPYEDGWMIEIEMADKNELDDLLSAEEYKEQLQEDSE